MGQIIIFSFLGRFCLKAFSELLSKSLWYKLLHCSLFLSFGKYSISFCLVFYIVEHRLLDAYLSIWNMFGSWNMETNMERSPTFLDSLCSTLFPDLFTVYYCHLKLCKYHRLIDIRNLIAQSYYQLFELFILSFMTKIKILTLNALKLDPKFTT